MWTGDSAWLNQFPDQSYDGDALGRSRLYFVDGWEADAVLPLEVDGELGETSWLTGAESS
jgi:hypothetical protein